MADSSVTSCAAASSPAWREIALAGVLTIGLLGFHLGDGWLASGYVDPISRAGAQDEAVYGHASIRMAAGGDWLTPIFLDRPLLNKPPLLHWAGAFSVWMFGISTTALRIVPFASGVAVCLIVFLWVRSSQPAPAAFAATLLIAANPTFHFFSRRFLMDSLLVVWITFALFLFSRDPKLERQAAVFGIGASCGLAVMAKSIAGLLPLAVMAAFWLVAGRALRPSATRAAALGLCTVAVAAPWHIYQLIVHRKWFLAEYVGAQIVEAGDAIPLVPALTGQAAFFFGRLGTTDLLLVALAAAGAAVTTTQFIQHPAQTRQSSGSLLLCWVAVMALSLLLFRRQSLHYLLPVAPALAMLAVNASPLFRIRRGGVGLALVGTGVAIKCLVPDAPWSLDYRSGTTITSARALNRYCGMRRGNELIIVQTADEFYATALGLPFVRYAVFTEQIDPSKVPLFMPDLGVILPAAEFVRDRGRAYADDLQQWGAVSPKPAGTVIVLRSPQELYSQIAAAPDIDFFLPDSLRSGLPDSVHNHHVEQPSPAGYIYLLSQQSLPRQDPLSPFCLPDSGESMEAGKLPPAFR